MIKVSQKCETLEEGIKFMMAGAKADYVAMSTSYGKKELTGYSLEQTDNWDKKTKISQGKKYIKIVQDTGVFCFIVKEDFKHFVKGDVLKAGQIVGLIDTTDLHLKKKLLAQQIKTVASQLDNIKAEMEVQQQMLNNNLVNQDFMTN